jgi:hypothetical protein
MSTPRQDGDRPVDQEHPTVILCAGGPMLLRGDHVIEDADGVRHTTTRPVSAVCRCGKSSMQPWCDGTHKLVPAKNKPR